MKRLYILAILLFAGAGLNAQTGEKITLKNLRIYESGNNVEVSFTAEIDEAAVYGNDACIFSPVLTDGNYRVSLPAIIVEGKRIEATKSRRMWVSGSKTTDTNVVYAKNGDEIHYQYGVEAQEWMHGGEFRMESAFYGCGDDFIENETITARNLDIFPEPEPVEIVTEVKRFKPKSIADSLSVLFPFILPESMFEPDDPFKIYDEERDNSMIVYFYQSKHNIDKSYRDNRQTLINLTAAAEMILADPMSKIERVVVAGFSSPEGRFGFNDKLSFNRAVAVKKHLLDTSGLEDEQIWLYNGAEDWRGLRLLVDRSEMEDKEQILEIIDNIPIQDEKQNSLRLEALKKLNGGKPYRYMFKEYFPLLRNGAFIKIYYSNQ